MKNLTLEQLLAAYLMFWVLVGWVCLVWPRRRRPMATRRSGVLPAPDPRCVVVNLREPN